MYFAKYFETDEAPTYGDAVIITAIGYGTHSGVIMYCIGINQDSGIMKLSLSRDEKTVTTYASRAQCKKLKMFLCDTNINIGDKISRCVPEAYGRFPKYEFFNFDGFKSSTVNNQGDTIVEKGNNIGLRSDFCIIKGAISQEASWLNDNDRIDVDWIRARIYALGKVFPNYMLETLEADPHYKDNIERIFQIKCPTCNHFF